ncbi:hypothetical protein KI387_023482, partial [Taxus chinensis]
LEQHKGNEQKKDVVQLPSTPEKVKSRPQNIQEVKERSPSSKSSEEEEEEKEMEKSPSKLVRKSTRKRQPPKRYGYSPDY